MYTRENIEIPPVQKNTTRAHTHIIYYCISTYYYYCYLYPENTQILCVNTARKTYTHLIKNGVIAIIIMFNTHIYRACDIRY